MFLSFCFIFFGGKDVEEAATVVLLFLFELRSGTVKSGWATSTVPAAGADFTVIAGVVEPEKTLPLPKIHEKTLLPAAILLSSSVVL